MKLVQKAIFIGTLILSAMVFIYVLSFSTPWALGTRYGDFFTLAQTVNHLLYDWGLWTLIFSGCTLVVGSHKNRNFYLLNYVSIGLSAYFLIRTAQITLENVLPLKPLYLALPESAHRMVTAINGTLTPSTIVFDLAPVLADAMYAAAGFMIVFTLYKTINQILRAKTKKRVSSSEVRP